MNRKHREDTSPMKFLYDILGIGVVSVDDLYYVDSYPPPDSKTPVLRKERHCGGLAATALVAAARLGSSCAYAGMLGGNELSRFALQRFNEEGIDVTHLVTQNGASPIHATIIVDTTHQTRNIFFNASGYSGPHASLPPAEVIRSSRILLVDHFGVEGMIRAARVARDAGIPVIADFEQDPGPPFSELLELVDHLIVSQDFAVCLTGQEAAPAAARALWSDKRNTVVVTAGREGSWYVTGSDPHIPRHQTAFEVEVVDTTGCGDVFHGAYASALARGMGVADRVRFASATAALKVMKSGGQAGIPTRAAVENFLQSH